MYEFTARRTVPKEDDMAKAVARAHGDPAAFKPIYDQYFRHIYRYCLRRVGSAQDAEDLTSLIFTRALAGLGGYRGGSFAAWLFRIARNSVTNFWRDRHPTESLDAAIDVGVDDQTLGGLVEAEDRREMARLIAALPEEQREMLALRTSGGLSAKEVGQVLGKSEGAVRVAIHRTIEQLRAAAKESIR